MLTTSKAAAYLGIQYSQFYNEVINGRGPTASVDEPTLSTLAGGPSRMRRLFKKEDLDAWKAAIDRRRQELTGGQN